MTERSEGECQRTTEGPARVVNVPSGKFGHWDIKIGDKALWRRFDSKDMADELANEINRALAPLVAKSEVGEKLAEALKDAKDEMLHLYKEIGADPENGRERIHGNANAYFKAKNCLAAWEKANV